MPEAVIVEAVRTPIGRHGGVLKLIRPDDLAALVLAEVVKRAKVDPALVEEVYLGCANQAGEDNRDVARMALLLAGYPITVGGVTFNRLCASGLSRDQRRGPGDKSRRGRRVRGRRSGMHDPGPLRHGEDLPGMEVRQPDGL